MLDELESLASSNASGPSTCVAPTLMRTVLRGRVVKQFAEVKIHCGAIRVPPQKWA